MLFRRFWVPVLPLLFFCVVTPAPADAQQRLPAKVRSAGATLAPPPGLSAEEVARASAVLPEARIQGAGRGSTGMSLWHGPNKVPASSVEPTPPGMDRIPENPPAPPAGRRANAADLLQTIERLPGGAELLQAAKERGFVRSGRGGNGPFAIDGTGPVVTDGIAAVAQAEKLTLRWDSSRVQANGGDNRMAFMGGVNYGSWRFPTMNAKYGFSGGFPYTSLQFYAPTDGWYIVNLYGYVYANSSKTGANVSVSVSGIGTVQTFTVENDSYPLPKNPGWTDMPVLLELSAGYHSFYYYIEFGAWSPNTGEFVGPLTL